MDPVPSTATGHDHDHHRCRDRPHRRGRVARPM